MTNENDPLDFSDSLQQVIHIQVYEDVEHKKLYCEGEVVGFDDIGPHGYYINNIPPEHSVGITSRITEDNNKLKKGTVVATAVEFVKFNKVKLI
jgi:hypothetical protein